MCNTLCGADAPPHAYCSTCEDERYYYSSGACYSCGRNIGRERLPMQEPHH